MKKLSLCALGLAMILTMAACGDTAVSEPQNSTEPQNTTTAAVEQQTDKDTQKQDADKKDSAEANNKKTEPEVKPESVAPQQNEKTETNKPAKQEAEKPKTEERPTATNDNDFILAEVTALVREAACIDEGSMPSGFTWKAISTGGNNYKVTFGDTSTTAFEANCVYNGVDLSSMTIIKDISNNWTYQDEMDATYMEDPEFIHNIYEKTPGEALAAVKAHATWIEPYIQATYPQCYPATQLDGYDWEIYALDIATYAGNCHIWTNQDGHSIYNFTCRIEGDSFVVIDDYIE